MMCKGVNNKIYLMKDMVSLDARKLCSQPANVFDDGKKVPGNTTPTLDRLDI